MNYNLRTRDELEKELDILRSRTKYLRDTYLMALRDIAADKQVIEIELKLLASIGKNKKS